jgi:hypothetical protein
MDFADELFDGTLSNPYPKNLSLCPGADLKVSFLLRSPPDLSFSHSLLEAAFRSPGFSV